ncbi:hypothetical protein HGA13_15845 [Nocardia speluncae]|uniref:DNA primase n=1 Tax=Nocardia speluncae TaxID=419477 RepID=A0A846XGQ5_9NOCA|nr:hypothetical protein [Nocardia speluncae]NKY34535.1 hypothetical protein [Nocardia speluncae]
MKCGMRMAGAVGIGYVLGRTRKMKFALMLAGVGLSGRGGPQALLERTTSAVGSSPELAKITETVRGELLEAARSAAVAAASNRIDSLNARLQHHGDIGAELGDAIPDEDAGDTGEPVDDDGDETAGDDEAAEPPPKRRTSARTRSAASRARTGERRVRTPARAAAAATSRRRADAGESATENAPVRRTRR